MFRLAFSAIVASVLLSGMALAQQPATYKARLAPDAKNIGLCNELDSGLAREQTVTVTPTGATLVGAGGNKSTMKLTSPNVYQDNRMQMGANQFLVVADLTKTPKTLTVTDNRLGCRWTGPLS